LKLKYLNLHTGYYDEFGGWYIKQDTVNVEKQIYNRQKLGDMGTRQALPELTDEFILISYDLPIDQANYIAKSIIMSPKTFLIDTDGNEVECVVMNKNYTDALSVVNVFSNINLNIKL
jgi:peroxiredoxin